MDANRKTRTNKLEICLGNKGKNLLTVFLFKKIFMAYPSFLKYLKLTISQKVVIPVETGIQV